METLDLSRELHMAVVVPRDLNKVRNNCKIYSYDFLVDAVNMICSTKAKTLLMEIINEEFNF